MDCTNQYEELKNETLQRYQARFEKEGVSPKALGWGCKEDQLERFSALCDNIDLEGKCIVDLGCGFADFYGFLLEKNIQCKYIGVDLIPEFVQCCNEKYGDSAQFILADIMMEQDKIPQADVVISSGTLNKKHTVIDNLEYTNKFMKMAFSKAKEVLILDFLSSKLTPEYPKEDFVYYHDYKDVMEMAFELTNEVKLIHNYRPIPQKEFICMLYKETYKYI